MTLLRAVGEGDRAGGLQKTDLGHLLAFEALGQRRHRLHADDCGVARAPQDEVDDRRIVDCGRGVGLADDGGDAARRRRLARGRERLAIFRARLADEGAHVDQAGRDDPALAVDDLGAFRHAGGADAALGFADRAVGNQEIARKIEIARRIDDPGVGEQDRAAVREHGRQTFGRLRERASSTAMRTATPISTCSRISDCAPSATAESISTPRFIGPGCITSASGLA